MSRGRWIAGGGLLAVAAVLIAGALLRAGRGPAPSSSRADSPGASSAAVSQPARDDGFPRPTIFRTGLEDLPQRRATNDEAIALAGPYDLVLAKALDEEVLGRERVAPYLRAIKAAAPEKIVLDHFLLMGRNPGSQYPPIWPGHWLLMEATGITRDVAGDASARQVTVADGAALRAGEDAQIVALGADGRPDFGQVEEVRVTTVEGTRVALDRGQRGTKPLAFAAGRARIASHATVTYSETTGPIWKTNFCREAPRDPQGRRFIESLADSLAGYLKPDGPLAGLDGYQFDVAAFSTNAQNQGRRRLDCDADGRPDAGFVNGVSSYGLGVVEFQRRLRSLVGDRTLLVSEATGWWSSRDVAYANGIENESFPDLHHWEQFSSAYQRYQFWRQQARSPRLSYLQLKETIEAFTRCPAEDRGTNWKLRLSMGAALLGDGYFAYMSHNEDGRPECDWIDPTTRSRVAVPDEFMGGTLNRRHYLGAPMGETQRVNLRGSGSTLFARDFEADTGGASITATRGAEATVARDATNPGEGGGALRIDAQRLLPEPDDQHLRVSLGPFRLERGREVTVRLLVRADPGYARIDPMFAGTPRRVALALNVRGTPTAAQDVMADATWRRYELAFVPAQDDPAATLSVLVGNEPGSVWIDTLSVERGPADTFFRAFAHGAVLVNGSSEPATFDLDALAPGRALRRLEGRQDAAVNNGQPARGRVTLPARDALILVE